MSAIKHLLTEISFVAIFLFVVVKNPHKCHICYKEFSQKCHLVQHVRNHTGEKHVVCNICEKTFSHKTYDYHTQNHEKEKSYICSVCNVGFICPHHLQRHV